MYVCVCRAINERQLRQLVRDGAHDVRAVNRCSGLGGVCGRCVPHAQTVISDERECSRVPTLGHPVVTAPADERVRVMRGTVPA